MGGVQEAVAHDETGREILAFNVVPAPRSGAPSLYALVAIQPMATKDKGRVTGYFRFDPRAESGCQGDQNHESDRGAVLEILPCNVDLDRAQLQEDVADMNTMLLRTNVINGVKYTELRITSRVVAEALAPRCPKSLSLRLKQTLSTVPNATR